MRVMPIDQAGGNRCFKHTRKEMTIGVAFLLQWTTEHCVQATANELVEVKLIHFFRCGVIVRFNFRIHASKADGTKNYRFHKVRYTAALRFGVVLNADNGYLQLAFDGKHAADVIAHEGNEAYDGVLLMEGGRFDDVIAIVKPRHPNPILITFWPRSQHPDAHQSYTDPLVDTAMDGTPFDIEIVASRMHEVFKENAGASPATLMKLLYEEETENLRQGAQRLGVLLQESFERERNIALDRDKQKAARADAEKERDEAQEKLKSLQKQVFIDPPLSTKPDLSKPAVLLRAEEGVAGKQNQRAVVLYLSDGTVRSCNWARNFEARLQYAKKLEGTVVQTDVWGGWNGLRWFNNIYPTTISPESFLSSGDELPF